MADWTVAELVEDFKAGRVERRRFIAMLASVGIGMPLISAILSACGSSSNNNKAATNTTATKSNSLVIPPAGAASPAVSAPAAASSAVASSAATKAAASPAASAAASPAAFTPTKRGGGGALKLLWWQAVSILNPHMSNGTKDQNGSRIFLEPLADFDQDGNLIPVLAAEIPSLDKGSVAKDLTSVTWKLKPNVTWHDGTPFTADDVKFTADYILDPTTAAFSAGHYKTVKQVDVIDPLTVKITFTGPTLIWADAFVGDAGMILPKKVHEQYKGATAKDAPANLKPIGTGPYKIKDFKPNDTVLGDINTNYHVANWPFFDSIEMKGGGDAPGSARAVLETGEYDYAWNLQVSAPQLLDLEKKGVGRLLTWNGGSIEHIEFNFTDPNKDVNGEKSSLQAPHPFLTVKEVRQAITIAIDRQSMVDQLYGPTGVVGTFWNYNPKKYVPANAAAFKPDPATANKLLDTAGWAKGGDGIRAKGGVKMHALYQTSINQLRQDEQAIVKKNLGDIGIDVELKSVDAGVFFGGDANPDNFPHFYADFQMFTSTRSAPDDYLSFMQAYYGPEARQKENNWSKQNTARYQNPAYDKLYDAMKAETDPVKAATLVQQMNQLLIDDYVIVPLVGRNSVAAAKKNLQGFVFSGWANELWKLPFWYRQA